ncbi:hypothetical protein [Streptomyces chattanoogensis]|uniref:hypothetical protein n=1 Tax=Streptomyces chattanoogensis TaxID=66876 RepID=UPI00369FFBBA
MKNPPLPHRKALRTLSMVTAVTAAALSGCATGAGKTAYQGPTSTSPSSVPPPRPVVTSNFQGEAVVHLPRHGTPKILDYRYALVDTR